MSRKTITCITCPSGCKIEVVEGEKGELQMTGYSCKRGIKYATSEFYNPSRILATTVRILGAALPLLPVRSKEPVPKGELFAIMDKLATLNIEAPINVGDVILSNVLDTGVDVVATRTLELI